jgi:hypothetical protein
LIAFPKRAKLTPSNKARGKKMPTFRRWQQFDGYFCKAEHSYGKRHLIGYFFTDALPYFYGTNIQLTLLAYRKNRKVAKNTEYEWILCGSDEQPVPQKTGKGNFIINRTSKYSPSRKLRAIDIGYLSKVMQYKVKMRLISESGESDYITIAEFTLKDRDEFYTQVFWPAFIATTIGLLLGVIGWLIGRGMGSGS